MLVAGCEYFCIYSSMSYLLFRTFTSEKVRNMNEALIKHLETQGVENAEELLKGFEPVQEESVSVDALEAAIEDLQKAMEQDNNEATEKAMSDMSSLEEGLKAMAEQTDRILADNKQSMDAILRAVSTLADEMKALRRLPEEMKGMYQAARDEMRDDVEKSLKMPLPPRAVIEAEPVVSAPAISRSDLISKAITFVQAEDATADRRQSLLRAVSLLESGADINAVAAQYNLN